MDKNVFNKQQVLTNEVGVKLKQESEIVLQTESTQSKTITGKEEKKDYNKKEKKKKQKEKLLKRKKFIEEEFGQIIDFKG